MHLATAGLAADLHAAPLLCRGISAQLISQRPPCLPTLPLITGRARVSYVAITDYTPHSTAITVSHSLNFTVQTALVGQWQHAAVNQSLAYLEQPIDRCFKTGFPLLSLRPRSPHGFFRVEVYVVQVSV